MRTTVAEGKIDIGRASLSYEVKVKMAYKPLTFDIVHYSLEKLP